MKMDFLNSLKGGSAGLKGSIGDAGSGAVTFMGNTGMILLWTFLFAAVIGFGYLPFRYFWLYNVDVFVFRKYQSGYKTPVLKGKYARRGDGKYCFYALMKWWQIYPILLPLTDQKFFTVDPKGGEKVFLQQLAKDSYKPINFYENIDKATTEKDIQVAVVNQNASNHAIQLHKEAIDRYRVTNKMATYAPIIALLIVGLISCGMMWITVGGMKSMSSETASAAKSIGTDLEAAGTKMAIAVEDFGKATFDAREVLRHEAGLNDARSVLG